MPLYETIQHLMKEISDHLTMQEICNKAVRINPAVFFHILECFKTKEMCTKAVEEEQSNLR